MSNVGSHDEPTFYTSHKMSVDVSDGDPKFSTSHTLSNVGTHGDPKSSTSHTMSVDISQNVKCWFTR